MNKFLIIILAGIAVSLIWGLGIYNGFIGQVEDIKTSWAKVETQYQRRFDLIPNLEAATRGFLGQERAIFKDIAEARTRYAGTASGSDERVKATTELESTLSRLLVIIENYPELKSGETVRALMDELAGTENRVTVARDRYNETVRPYNTARKRFPGALIANIFGFDEKPLFEAVTEAEEAPKIDLEVNNNEQ